MYYIYILKNPTTGLPFYVGVGKRNRKSSQAREHSHITEALKFRSGILKKGSNRHKLNTILQILDSGLQVDIEIGNEFDSEIDAFNEEISLITHFGRRDLGTGILTNMTGGGEGRVNPSIEERRKASALQKGKTSPLKGKILGDYSEERKQSQKEKMRIKRDNLTEEDKQIQHTNRSTARSGIPAWNKGKTKETSESVAKYANKKIGKPRPDLMGKEPWNKGKTKETDTRIKNTAEARLSVPSPRKGIPSGKKGLTYAEIYGPEKAAELKEKRRLKKVEYWQNKSNASKI